MRGATDEGNARFNAGDDNTVEFVGAGIEVFGRAIVGGRDVGAELDKVSKCWPCPLCSDAYVCVRARARREEGEPWWCV